MSNEKITVKIDSNCEKAIVCCLKYEQARMLMEMFSTPDFVGVDEKSSFRLFSDLVSKAKSKKEGTVTISRVLYDNVQNLSGNLLNVQE